MIVFPSNMFTQMLNENLFYYSITKRVLITYDRGDVLIYSASIVKS